MTLEEQYQLSFYKECAEIGERDDIHLVQNTENKKFYVKKDLTIYNVDVYRRMMQINDSRIPRIYECVEADGHLIVIEEYVNGDSLQNVIDQQGPLNENQVLNYMIRLCDSVQILHMQQPPIIHRDIKPSNIIISNEGNLKLIDVNIAKPYTQKQTQDTILIGTKEFAAPEQYGFRQSDVRTDVYAMGVTMNYLLLGKVPREEIYQGNVRTMIEKCIEMDPKNRYQTVQELKTALQNLQKNLHGGKQSVEATPLYQKQESHPVNEQIFKGNEAQSTWRRFLPPGFRSGKIWKMILALLGYTSIIGMSLTSEMKANGVALSGVRMIYERAMMLSLFLVCIVFACDYLGIRRKVPFFKPENKPIKGTQIALYTLLVGFVWMLFWVMIENIIWPV